MKAAFAAARASPRKVVSATFSAMIIFMVGVSRGKSTLPSATLSGLALANAMIRSRSALDSRAQPGS